MDLFCVHEVTVIFAPKLYLEHLSLIFSIVTPSDIVDNISLWEVTPKAVSWHFTQVHYGDYNHTCTDFDWSSTFASFVNTAVQHDLYFWLQYIPGHVGIEPNEMVDDLAHHYATNFECSVQQHIPIELKSLKTLLKRAATRHWLNTTPTLGARYNLCGIQRSRLKQRRATPRALQTLYSRWHVGEVETAGIYPRRMKWID